MENYVSLKVDKHLIFNLTKFRISNHQLEIVTGRYKKTRIDQRLCKFVMKMDVWRMNFTF